MGRGGGGTAGRGGPVRCFPHNAAEIFGRCMNLAGTMYHVRGSERVIGRGQDRNVSAVQATFVAGCTPRTHPWVGARTKAHGHGSWWCVHVRAAERARANIRERQASAITPSRSASPACCAGLCTFCQSNFEPDHCHRNRGERFKAVPMTNLWERGGLVCVRWMEVWGTLESGLDWQGCFIFRYGYVAGDGY